MERARVRMHVDGVERDGWAWSDLRELFSAYLDAVCAAPDAPPPASVVFLEVGEGSAEPRFAAPRPFLVHARRFALGPTARWTPEQRRRAEPFYEIVRRGNLRIETGQRKLTPVVIPDASRRWTLREHGEIVVRVHTVGFRDLHAQVDVDGAIVRCDGSESLVDSLGAHLRKDVLVSGILTYDVATRALLNIKAIDFRPIKPKLTVDESLERVYAAGAGRLDGQSMKALFSRTDK